MTQHMPVTVVMRFKIGSRQGLQETIFDTTYVNGDVSGNMMEAYQPDVIMLQIGTNDVLDAQLTGIGDRLEELVDKLIPYVSGDGQVLYLASIPNIDAIERYDWLGAYEWTYGVSYKSDPEKFVATVQAAVDDYNTIVKNLVAKSRRKARTSNFLILIAQLRFLLAIWKTACIQVNKAMQKWGSIGRIC